MWWFDAVEKCVQSVAVYNNGALYTKVYINILPHNTQQLMTKDPLRFQKVPEKHFGIEALMKAIIGWLWNSMVDDWQKKIFPKEFQKYDLTISTWNEVWGLKNNVF